MVDLTNADVADILALLDSLPYDSLDVQTPRFRLTLRRAPGGGWSEESQVLAEPVVVTPAPNGMPAAPAGEPGTSEMSGGAGRAGTAEAARPGDSARPGDGARPGDSARPGEGDAARSGAGNSPGAAGAAAAGQPAGLADADGLAVVAAPLPGTFYRAPRPGAEPFVQVGDEVAADTVVAIVETMKLMNSVHAGTAGRVSRICVGNGEFTALGTTLMLIEPAA
jgi:acetyl-CoA carboxylase biotin carboxyl carrier protein